MLAGFAGIAWMVHSSDASDAHPTRRFHCRIRRACPRFGNHQLADVEGCRWRAWDVVDTHRRARTKSITL
jgi:hypothetical protein